MSQEQDTSNFEEQLTEEINLLSSIEKQITESLKSLETQFDDASPEIAAKESEINTLFTEAKELLATYHENNVSIANTSNLVTNLRASLSETNKMYVENFNMLNKGEDLTKEILSSIFVHEQAVNLSNEQLLAKEAELNKHLKNLDSILENTTRAHEEELKQLELNKAKSERDLIEIKQAANELNEFVENRKLHALQLANEVADIKEKRQAIDLKTNKLIEESINIKNELNTLKLISEEKSNEHDQLFDSIKLLEHENGNITASINMKKTEVTNLNKEIKKKTKENIKINAELRDLNLKADKFKKESLTKVQKCIDKSNSVKEKLNKFADNLEDTTELEKECENVIKEHQNTSKELKDLAASIKNIKKGNNTLKDKNDNILKEIDEINKENEKYKEEIAVMNGQIDLLKMQNKKDEEKLQQDLMEIKEQLTKLSEEFDSKVKEEMEDFDKFNAVTNTEKDILLDDFNNSISKAENEMTLLESEILKETNEINDLKVELARLEKEGEVLAKQAKAQTAKVVKKPSFNPPEFSDSSMEGDCYVVNRNKSFYKRKHN